MSHPVFTRQLFCSRCLKDHRPHRDNKFIVLGEKGLHLRIVERFVDPKEHGFTPHLVSIYKLLDDKTVAITRVCCMLGCGVDLVDEGNNYKLTYKHVSYNQITLTDWNALVKEGKNFGYKI